MDAQHLDLLIKILDAVERGEMPPKKKKQPAEAEKMAFVKELEAKLMAMSAPATGGRIRLRRMTRVEFQNTLQDLLALPRLDVVGLLPADGRVAGYDKIAGALDISPAHLAAYEEAVEEALDAAIERLFAIVFSRAPSAEEKRDCLARWRETIPLVQTAPAASKPPLEVRRDAVEENTGEKFSFSEKLHACLDFVPDLQPAEVDARTRALADACLVPLNSNEFAYVY